MNVPKNFKLGVSLKNCVYSTHNLTLLSVNFCISRGKVSYQRQLFCKQMSFSSNKCFFHNLPEGDPPHYILIIRLQEQSRSAKKIHNVHFLHL